MNGQLKESSLLTQCKRSYMTVVAKIGLKLEPKGVPNFCLNIFLLKLKYVELKIKVIDLSLNHAQNYTKNLLVSLFVVTMLLRKLYTITIYKILNPPI